MFVLKKKFVVSRSTEIQINRNFWLGIYVWWILKLVLAVQSSQSSAKISKTFLTFFKDEL